MWILMAVRGSRLIVFRIGIAELVLASCLQSVARQPLARDPGIDTLTSHKNTAWISSSSQRLSTARRPDGGQRPPVSTTAFSTFTVHS